MNRERALKILLVLVGLLFSAGIYPLTVSLWKMKQADYGDDMMLSLYFALGIFLLLAARNPSANRSLIAFAAWSSFAHAAVMAVLAVHIASERRDLVSAVVRCAGNLMVSLGAIQAMPALRALLSGLNVPRGAVTPIVGNAAVSGPAGQRLAAAGHDVSVLGLARLYAEALSGLGLGSMYVRGDVDLPLEFGPFEGNPLTSDRERYLRNRLVLQASPALGLGSPRGRDARRYRLLLVSSAQDRDDRRRRNGGHQR